MKRIALTLLCIALGALAACSPYQVRSDYDLTADFAKYKTFALVPPPAETSGETQAVNPLLDGRIRTALERELPTKGFTAAGGQEPDILVGYFMVVEEKQDYHWVYTYWGWGGVAEPMPYTYSIGSIVVDLVDAKTKKLLWRGSATAGVATATNPAQSQQKVDAAIRAILAKYPPAAK